MKKYFQNNHRDNYMLYPVHLLYFFIRSIQWLDYGAIICAIVGILFHPFSTSFWGIVEIITTFIAIYGMLIVKKKTGNAWGAYLPFVLFGMPYKSQLIFHLF